MHQLEFEELPRPSSIRDWAFPSGTGGIRFSGFALVLPSYASTDTLDAARPRGNRDHVTGWCHTQHVVSTYCTQGGPAWIIGTA